MKDPYRALGVSRTASQADVKKAFKALARKYHPDRNKEPGAEAKFKEASVAYDIIGDPGKRKLWDEFGEASLAPGFDPSHYRMHQNPFTGGADFGDFFSSFFSTGGVRGGRGPQRAPPRDDGTRRSRQQHRRPPPRPTSAAGADLKGETRVPLATAIRGGEIEVTVDRPKPGVSGRTTACTTCRGTGRQVIKQFGMEATIRCEACGGQGEIPVGGRTETEQVKLKVRNPPGIEDGQSLRLRGQGAKGVGGAPDGDLVLTVHVSSDPRLVRKGRDLELEVPLTLSEAVRGGTIAVNTPAGTFKVRVPPNTQNGARLRLRQKGIAGDGVKGPGDLYLVLRPQLPASGDGLAELADQFDDLYDGDIRSELDF